MKKPIRYYNVQRTVLWHTYKGTRILKILANRYKTGQYAQVNDQLHSLDKTHLHFYEQV